MNKNVLKNLTYGLYVISSLNDTKPTGCVANCAMQITHDTIAISLNHSSFTLKCIKKSNKFGISILAETVSPKLIGNFGYKTGQEFDKFSNAKSINVEGVTVLAEGSCGYIVCEVIDMLETETHTLFLGKIIEGDVLDTQKPMTYAYYHSVLKGASPKEAPTYIDETSSSTDESIKYKCSVCGYIYIGDINKEPDDYECPICGQPKDVFELYLG